MVTSLLFTSKKSGPITSNAEKPQKNYLCAMERVDAVLMGSGVIIGAFLQQVTQNFGE